MSNVGAAAEAVPSTVKLPVILTASPKKASSSTYKSPRVVILSVVVSPSVKSPLTPKSPVIETEPKVVVPVVSKEIPPASAEMVASSPICRESAETNISSK